MMANRPVRIGLLGLGQMGRNHLRILSMLRDVDLAFVYDANPAHCQALAAQHGVAAVQEVEAAAAGVDAIVVCTPTSTHADYIRRLAPLVRGLFIEKPLAHSLEAAQAVTGVVEAHGTFVQVGFIERFNPAVIGLQRVMQDAERVINVDFTRTNRLSSRITDVDVIMDLMVHDLDLALYLNGPVRQVEAHGVVEGGLIEFASAMLMHENGRFSRVQASRITEKKIRLIQATCSDRFVDCDLLRKEIIISRQSVTSNGGAGGYSISSQQDSVVVGQQEALLSELQAFVRAVQGGERQGLPDFAAGLASLEVSEAVRSAVLRSCV
jgi:predicted dehydrogenase